MFYLTPLWLFFAVLAFFHTSEFCLAWRYTPQQLGLSSWLISPQYCAAMLCAVTEYLLEIFLFERTKEGVMVPGLTMIIIGETIRKSAMVTAKGSFTHHLAVLSHPTNTLITEGPYKYVRHPGYFGWGIWAIGTQVLLGNPVCTVAFAFAACRFFRQRIQVEEEALLSQFGAEYAEYRKATSTYIPFVP